MENNYDDIINLPHPISKTHKKMSMNDRAAQFSPFSALTGYEDIIDEAAKISSDRLNVEETSELFFE